MTKNESIKVRLGGVYIEQVKIMESLHSILTIMEEVEAILEEGEVKKGGCECDTK